METQLIEIKMKTFKEYIVENSNKLYFVNMTLWLAHGQSSGFTSQVSSGTSYLTNKASDKNYDAIVEMINKSISSLKTKENSSIISYHLKKDSNESFFCLREY